MSSDGKVRVVVKSRKVPSGMVQLRQTTYLLSGVSMMTRADHHVLYDYVLDEDHQKAIKEARKLASNLCLDLEVIDSGRQGFFGRLLSSLGRRGAGNPTVEVSPPSTTMAPNYSGVSSA